MPPSAAAWLRARQADAIRDLQVAAAVNRARPILEPVVKEVKGEFEKANTALTPSINQQFAFWSIEGLAIEPAALAILSVSPTMQDQQRAKLSYRISLMAHSLMHAAEKFHWHDYIGPIRLKHWADAFETEFRHPFLRKADMTRYFNFADLIYDEVLKSPFYKGRHEVLAALRLRDEETFGFAQSIHIAYRIPTQNYPQLNQDQYETELLIYLFLGRLHKLGDQVTLETEKVKRLEHSMEHHTLHEKLNLYFAAIHRAKTPSESIAKSTHVVP